MATNMHSTHILCFVHHRFPAYALKMAIESSLPVSSSAQLYVNKRTRNCSSKLSQIQTHCIRLPADPIPQCVSKRSANSYFHTVSPPVPEYKPKIPFFETTNSAVVLACLSPLQSNNYRNYFCKYARRMFLKHFI